MAHKPHKETGIFINEVSSHQRRYHKVLELTHSTTKAAGVMLLGAIVALVEYGSARRVYRVLAHRSILWVWRRARRDVVGPHHQ